MSPTCCPCHRLQTKAPSYPADTNLQRNFRGDHTTRWLLERCIQVDEVSCLGCGIYACRRLRKRMTMYMTLLAAVDASLDLLNRAADNQNVLMQNALIRKRAHGRMRCLRSRLPSSAWWLTRQGASWQRPSSAAYSWEACGESLARGMRRRRKQLAARVICPRAHPVERAVV
jgi:hypothetical protein